MKITSKPLGIMILVIMFGGIIFSNMMNWWNTESTKIPAVYTSGEAIGEYNPEDIRGSYTFGEISQLFNVPIEDLKVAFNLPEGIDPATFGAKDLESIYEFSDIEIGTESLRLFVALYRNLPFTLDDDIFLPEAAVEILVNKARLTDEQTKYLENHTIIIDHIQSDKNSAEGLSSQTIPTLGQTPQVDEQLFITPVPDIASEDHEASEERLIKGKTTFRELLDWGLPQEEIEEVIGNSLPNPLMLIKDYCTESGLDFGTIKTALQERVDQLITD